MQLTEIEKAAVAKAVAGDKKEIAAGNYTGSVIIKVDYSLRKGENYEAEPTANILSKAVIAKAAAMMGFQAENFFNALERAAMEALTNDGNVSDGVIDERVKAKLAEIEEKVIRKLPKQPRSGSTTVKANVTVLSGANQNTLENVA